MKTARVKICSQKLVTQKIVKKRKVGISGAAGAPALLVVEKVTGQEEEPVPPLVQLTVSH